MRDKNKPQYPPNHLLRDARLEHGWSQKDLAKLLKTTQVVVSRWETGKSFPEPHHRKSLAELFKKSMAELGLIPPSEDSESIINQTEDSALVNGSLKAFKIVNIPFMPNPFFIGRDDLLESLHKQLSSDRSVALIRAQALFGLGGIGKTQAAVEYVYRYIEEYAHIFWIRAETRELLIADVVNIANLLKLPEKNETNPSQIVIAVKRWLAENPDWLAIFDNADNLPLAQEFLPGKHNGYILYTTRAQASGAIAASVEVEGLSPDDSILLLLRQSKILKYGVTLDDVQSADRIAAKQIAEEMAGLPLGLAQASAYVEEMGCTLADYFELYATHRNALLARGSELLGNDLKTVATTWSVSFQQIEQQNPASADMLRLLAFLAPDALPEELLLAGAGGLDTATGAIIANKFGLNETVEKLRKYSMIQRDSHTHSFSIHRLVQIIVRENIDKETQRAWAIRAVRVVSIAFTHAQSKENKDKNYQYYLQYYLPHVHACATLIEEYHLMFEEAAQLLYQAGAFLYTYGYYHQARVFHTQALTIRRLLPRDEELAISESLKYLARIAKDFEMYEQAEEYLHQVIKISEKIYGATHEITGESYNNLGVLYREQRKYEQAEPLLQKALAIFEQTYSHERDKIVIATLSLAKLQLEQKKYAPAKELLTKSLELAEDIWKPGYPGIAFMQNLRARLAYEQGDQKQAEHLWQQALEILEKALGLEHPALAEILDSLAELYFAQGHYAEAESRCQRALSICENKVGAEHSDTISYREHLNKITSQKLGVVK